MRWIATQDERKMKFTVSILFILVLTILTSEINAKADSCQNLFKKDSPLDRKQEALIEAEMVLRDLPQMRPYVLDVLSSSEVSADIVRLFVTTLKSNLIAVFRMDRDFTEKFKVPDFFAGGYFSIATNFQVFSRASDLHSTNGGHMDRINDAHKEILFHKKTVLFVPDQIPFHGQINFMITLFHELAHVRFIDFLNRHLESLIGKVPTDLLYLGTDGRVHMDSQLYTYLQERYAFESEIRFVREIYANPKWYNETDANPLWRNLKRSKDDKAALREIVKTIYRRYPELKDPRLHDLDSLRVSEIFSRHRHYLIPLNP